MPSTILGDEDTVLNNTDICDYGPHILVEQKTSQINSKSHDVCTVKMGKVEDRKEFLKRFSLSKEAGK